MAYKYLDILKSSENHNKWEEITSLLTSYSKDQNEVVNSVSQSLLHLNNYTSKSRKQNFRNDKEKSLKYLKLICKLKNLNYSEIPRNCLELSCDYFRIIISLNDNRNSQSDYLFKQIIVEYNKEKQMGSAELLKSLSDGCYDQLLHHISELQNLYAVGHDKQEQCKTFLCLQSLEEDISNLSKCPLNVNNIDNECTSFIPPPTNLIGIFKNRSGGIPAQFVYYCPIGSSSDGENSDRFKIILKLMKHHEKKLLPFVPLVNLLKDINGNSIPSYVTPNTMKCLPMAAKFVLKLSHPLVMCNTNIEAILSITELDVMTTGIRMNYIDMILYQNGSSLIYKDQFYSILPNDNQLVFQITENEVNIGAQTVTCIPFLLPNQLPRIVAILKKQTVINCMLESFLLGDLNTPFIKDMINAHPVNVSIMSHDIFVFSYNRENANRKLVKFSFSFNEMSQVLIKFFNPTKTDSDSQNSSKFQKIVQKFNNLPMAIFWLLYKSGDFFVMETKNLNKENNVNANSLTSYSLLELNDSNKFMEDNQFVDSCIATAKSNLSIHSICHKDIFPKIKIEPKLELLTTTSQQIISSPLVVLPHDGLSNIGKSKSGLLYNHEHPNPPMAQSSCPIDCNNSSIPIIGGNNPNIISQVQPHKSEPTVPYPTYGSKHMSLDQMLSSDFVLPFSNEQMGSLNPLSHSMHYSDHPSHPSISVANNNYPPHFNNGPHQKDVNPKLARHYDPQSSVLVNLLNCNENPGSNNSSGFINRPMSRNISNPSPMPDQFESPLMHSHLSRIPQIPRLRMPHPNQPKPIPTPNVTSPRPSLSAISSSPPSKPDIMMMPYPQDTGNGRALMSRKPRKRKISTLELNQRLPKQPIMQPPTLRQPMHHDILHNSNPMVNHSMQHMSNNSSSGPQHPSHSVSNSNFSSPTTMDQSIYDFDDNTDGVRSRNMLSSGNNQSQSNNFNNPLNRKLANAPSKKSLKVKISRKSIPQNPGSQEFKQFCNQDQEIKLKEKMAKSGNIPMFNPNINNVRSTAIMNAIDSPLTCSSLSSMQTSPHGSVSVSCSQMSGSIDSNNDPTLMKKRRKRRLKSELEDTAESLKKKEKLEFRKQNRKKKELLLSNGNSQSGMSSNSSLETVPSTDISIKAPLPIKLSLNPKTGSVSNNNSNNSSNSNSNSSNSMNNRISKNNLQMASQSTSSNSTWMNQNSALLKQSMKSELKQQTSLIAEPLLKNYKIPKKKSSDLQIPVPFQESVKSSVHSNPQFSKSHSAISQNDISKPTGKESSEFMKSEPELSVNSTQIERPKTPIMLHPDAAVSLSQQQSQIANSVSDHDLKHYPADILSNSAPSKQKNIHDIVDKLRARNSSASGGNNNSNNTDSVSMNNSAIANAISDYSPSKTPISSFNPDNTPNSTENIFEKFSSSKNNGKSDHRQFTNSRFPDPLCMNMPRYSYSRPPPPTGFSTPKLRPGLGAPIPYGAPIPRQTYMGNPNVYRMDSAPIRNFSPINPANVPYGPKKNTSNSFNNKKK